MVLLAFDFDSTLVTVEGLDELFGRSLDGHPEREARLKAFKDVTDLGMAGAISADESLRRRLGVLDVDRATIGAVAAQIQASITPSVLKHLGFFRENAASIHVVSGGFEELILPTMGTLGLPNAHLHAHRFQFDEHGQVTGLDPDTLVARGGKVEVVRNLGKDGTPIWIVGDGATDLEVRERGVAERFVAFTENRHRDPIVARADHVARSMDELIDLLARPSGPRSPAGSRPTSTRQAR